MIPGDFCANYSTENMVKNLRRFLRGTRRKLPPMIPGNPPPEAMEFRTKRSSPVYRKEDLPRRRNVPEGEWETVRDMIWFNIQSAPDPQEALRQYHEEVQGCIAEELREASPDSSSVILKRPRCNDNAKRNRTVKNKVFRVKRAMRTLFHDYGLTRLQQRAVCREFIQESHDREPSPGSSSAE